MSIDGEARPTATAAGWPARGRVGRPRCRPRGPAPAPSARGERARARGRWRPCRRRSGGPRRRSRRAGRRGRGRASRSRRRRGRRSSPGRAPGRTPASAAITRVVRRHGDDAARCDRRSSGDDHDVGWTIDVHDFPPLALPRSGSRVGDGVGHPLSPVPRAPHAGSVAGAAATVEPVCGAGRIRGTRPQQRGRDGSTVDERRKLPQAPESALSGVDVPPTAASGRRRT